MNGIALYILVSGLVMIFIEYQIRVNLWLANDREMEELFKDKWVKYPVIILFGLLWIITLPVMILNQKGD